MTSCIAVLTTWSKKGETSQRKTTAEHHQIREEGQRRLKSLLLAAAKERGRNLNAASALFFAVICWGGSIGTGNTNSLKKPIEKASSVIGCKPDPMEAVMERRMLNKLLSILDNSDHPLHPDLLPSSEDLSQTDWFSSAARRTDTIRNGCILAPQMSSAIELRYFQCNLCASQSFFQSSATSLLM